MDAYPGAPEATDWSKREHVFRGADPSRLPGRKLVAETCTVDLLAPMLADTCPIPEHVDLMIKAGWWGWSSGGVESSAGVVPPDQRTVSRYATELRKAAPDALQELVRDLALKHFHEQAGGGLERTLNAPGVKKLVCQRGPWVHREMLNRILAGLAESGWLLSTVRGFRFNPDRIGSPLPTPHPDVMLCEAFQDVYPALTAYTDLQFGSVAGLGWLIATPERLRALGQKLTDSLARVLEPLQQDSLELPPERRTLLRVYHMMGPMDEVPLDRSLEPTEEAWAAQQRAVNEEARLLGPFVSAAAFPGWGDPDEAWRGLKGAVALRLQSAFQGRPGGLYRGAHRYHGIGYGTLASYFDGPVLVGRNSGRIRAVREGESFRLESDSLRLLSQVYPDSRSERSLWAKLSDGTDSFTFQDYRPLLLKLAREGYLLMTRSGNTRCYRATRPYQSKPVLRTWNRWQKLWRWLPAFRQVARAVRSGDSGANIGVGRWTVDREDLPRIEEQIQREVNLAVAKELERFAHLDEVDHFDMGGKKSHIIIFTRREPWLLAHMEDP